MKRRHIFAAASSLFSLIVRAISFDENLLSVMGQIDRADRPAANPHVLGFSQLKAPSDIDSSSPNGTRLKVETRGPLWIMYPNVDHSDALLNDETTTKLVWSLTGLIVT